MRGKCVAWQLKVRTAVHVPLLHGLLHHTSPAGILAAGMILQCDVRHSYRVSRPLAPRDAVPMCAGTIQWVVDNPDRTRSHVPTYFTDHVPSSSTHRDRQFVLKIPTHSFKMMSKMSTMAPSSMAGHTGGRCDVSSLPIGEALAKEGVHMASPAPLHERVVSYSMCAMQCIRVRLAAHAAQQLYKPVL